MKSVVVGSSDTLLNQEETCSPGELEGSSLSPAGWQGCGFLCTSAADETSESLRPESPLQLVRPVASVENKVLGNKWVMSENVSVEKLFHSCFFELPAVHYLWLSKACCWTR